MQLKHSKKKPANAKSVYLTKLYRAIEAGNAPAAMEREYHRSF